MLDLACGLCIDQELFRLGPQLFDWLLTFLLWAIPVGIPLTVHAVHTGRRLPVPVFRYLGLLIAPSMFVGGSFLFPTALVLLAWVPKLARAVASTREWTAAARINRAFLVALPLLVPVSLVKLEVQYGDILAYYQMSRAPFYLGAVLGEAALVALIAWGWRAGRAERAAPALAPRARPRLPATVEVQTAQTCPLCREPTLAGDQALRVCLTCRAVAHAACERELGPCCRRSRRGSLDLPAERVRRREGPAPLRCGPA